MSAKVFFRVLAVFSLLAAAACGGSGPEDTVEAFYKALAGGDEKALAGLMTGAALESMPAGGTGLMSMAKVMGKAYRGVAKVTAKGDRARVIVKMDGRAIAQALVAASKKVLAEIKDPALMAKIQKGLAAPPESLATRYSTMPLTLVKVKGRWLVADLR